MKLPHLATHLAGPNELRFTSAVQPLAGAAQLRQGYRVSKYRDPRSRLKLPMISAAVSAEKVFEVFLDLLRPMGDTVHVVLESSHDETVDRHTDLRRSDIDLPVLMSHCCDYEELLMTDGCTGIAVLSAESPIEVQFDEHKLLYVYTSDLTPFRAILKGHGVPRRETMRLITESEHTHYSDETFYEQFEQFGMKLGIGDFDRIHTDDESWM